jgi:hypothetical protein
MQEKKKKEASSQDQSVNEKIAYWLDYFNKKSEKEKSNAKARHKKDQTDSDEGVAVH